jgi:hypothetical protein
MGWEQAKAKKKDLTSIVGNGKETLLGFLGWTPILGLGSFEMS